MKEYRIYTEDKPNLPAIVSRRFDAFTILRGTGYWKGQEEPSAVIVILTQEKTGWQDSSRGNINATCEAIRQENRQEAVLFTVQDVPVTVLTADGSYVQ